MYISLLNFLKTNPISLFLKLSSRKLRFYFLVSNQKKKMALSAKFTKTNQKKTLFDFQFTDDDSAVFLAIIVEKSKKCLDFSVTLFMIHFFICIGYNGMPRTWDWYIVHITATIVMILLGEYLCSRKELDEIPLLQI